MRFHDRLQTLGFQTYDEYLQSEHWKSFKKKYRSSGLPLRCKVCGLGPIQLHHVTYERLGKENVTDVRALCRFHHTEVHRILKEHGERVQKTDWAIGLLRGNVGKSVVMPEWKCRGCGGKVQFRKRKKLCKRCKRELRRQRQEIKATKVVELTKCDKCQVEMKRKSPNLCKACRRLVCGRESGLHRQQPRFTQKVSPAQHRKNISEVERLSSLATVGMPIYLLRKRTQ